MLKTLLLLSLPLTLFAQRRPSDKGIAYIDLDFIYMHAHEDGLPLAITDKNIDTATNASIGNGKIKEVKPKWKPAYRLTLSEQPSNTKWGYQLCWTYLKTKLKSQIAADTETLLAFAWSPTVFANPIEAVMMNNPQEGKGQRVDSMWKFKTHLIDLEICKRFMLKGHTRYAMRPHVGVRYAYIHQNLNIEHLRESLIPMPVTAQEFINLNHDYDGIGLRMGLDVEFGMCKSISLYGKSAAGALYSIYKIQNNARLVPGINPEVTINVSHAPHTTKFFAEFAVGLLWEYWTKANAFAVAINLGWEQHIFLDHNMLFRIASDRNYGGIPASVNGSLALSGAVAGLKLYF